MKSLTGNTRKPDITFYRSGLIEINASVISRLRISVGDVIDILTDGDEFYLYIKHHSPIIGRHEGRVRFTTGRHCRTSSVKLCKAILEECNVNDIARLSVGELARDERYGELLPIITKNLL